MLMNIEDENLQISISDKNFSETILEAFEYLKDLGGEPDVKR